MCVCVCVCVCIYIYEEERKWQPISVFLPGKSHGHELFLFIGNENAHFTLLSHYCSLIDRRILMF